MEEWKEYKLGDLIALNSGGTPDKNNKSYWEGDIPWISAKYMYDDYLYSSELKISQEGLANGSRLAPKGSILLLTRGSGLFNRIPVCYTMRDLAYNQDVKCIESCNKELVSTEFLFYWLMGNKDSISAILETTGIGAGKIDTNRLKNIRISLPSKKYQQALIEFAKSLMYKIEINRLINDNFVIEPLLEILLIWMMTTLINDNLEQQAQALFKSWFVDLKPFRDQPFVESELGMIPQGWRVESLSSIADYINGLAMQKYRPTGNETGLPVLKIKELGQGCCDDNSELCSPSLIGEKYIIDDGDIIFSWSGTLMVNIWCGGKCGLNQHLFVVKPYDVPKWFAYQWTKHHLDNFIQIAKDKAVTMGHIKRGELDKAKVLVPDKDNLAKISSLMIPIHRQIISRKIESRRLSSLRDTLLPRLMSGMLTSMK